VITGDITIKEGGDHAFIDVACTLPPRFRCDPNDPDLDLGGDNDTTTVAGVGAVECQTDVSVSVAIEDADLTCIESGERIPQALVGRVAGEEFVSVCGVRCTKDNW
jgi:hypothetical protein